MNRRLSSVFTLQIGVQAANDVMETDEVMGQLLPLCDTPIHSVVQAITELLDSDSDSEDGYVENFVSITVPSYTDIQFKHHFRMSRECFEVSI